MKAIPVYPQTVENNKVAPQVAVVNSELKAFLRLLIKRWWLILIILFITVAGTMIFTSNQTPVYTASATFIVTPSKDILTAPSILNSLSVLGSQSTVANTYAGIITSNAIKQMASESLGLSSVQTANLSVDSRVQNGTNIIEISVEGVDPLLVQAFANKIGESAISYIGNLYEVYGLRVLDSAKSPEEPIRPNKRLNLALSVAFGLVVGGALALLIGINEY